MQKVINALAVVSFVVSGAVVASSVYVYTQRDAIKDNIRQRVMEGVEDAIGGSELGSALINGSTGGVDVTDSALGVDTNPPVNLPISPF